MEENRRLKEYLLKLQQDKADHEEIMKKRAMEEENDEARRQVQELKGLGQGDDSDSSDLEVNNKFN